MKSLNNGVILIDILLALTLATLFVAIISESSQSSHDIYEYAKTRSQMIDQYEVGQFAVTHKAYGNERSEFIYSAPIDSSTTTNGSTSLQYAAVSTLPYSNFSDFAGTPLCSADFTEKGTIGDLSSISGATSIGGGTSTYSNLTPIIKTIVLPISSQLPLTHLEVRNGFAYISADSATASDPDLLIINIKDLANLILLTSINTGPGISSFAIAGKRIFAAAASTAGQLHVIRMDNLSSLVLEKKYKLPLPFATATSPVADSIFYNKDKVYLGTEKWDGDEFNIIDVSNPVQPLKLGGFEIGSKVNDIYVNQDAAYTASADFDEIRVIDVRNPLQPLLMNVFTPTGWQRQEGKSISIFEDAVNLGRTSGGYNITQDPEAITWVTTSSTTLSNYYSRDIAGGVYGIIADQMHIYLATRQSGKEFQIYDRTLSVPANSSTTSTYALSYSPQSMTCDGNNLYILAQNGPYIYQISFQ